MSLKEREIHFTYTGEVVVESCFIGQHIEYRFPVVIGASVQPQTAVVKITLRLE